MNAISYETTSEPQQLSTDANPVLWPTRYNGKDSHIAVFIATVQEADKAASLTVEREG
jgi:hypothetical protein|tara:strand:+ start:32593 stop:32766 length:174 start_codon:yes stop_codon:yes gene_type:complete